MPEPGPGQVRICVRAAGVGPTDPKVQRGEVGSREGSWFDVVEELVRQNAARLGAKVVIDPSNPVALGQAGQMSRTLPDGVCAG